MAYPTYQYPGYPQPYQTQPAPDQLAQLRQNQMQQPMMMQQVPQQMQVPAQMQQSVMQPQIPQMTLQNTPPQNGSGGIIWVQNRQEADSYLVAPGSAVALWDANSPVIYLRQADTTGKPSTKIYDLVERTETRPVQQAPQIDLSQFITRDELEGILAERLKRPSKAAQKKEDMDNG